MVCFCRDTLIETEGGATVPVQDLRVGQRVRTADHGYQAIRWIGRRRLGATELSAMPRLRPVRIRAGALGPDLPVRDLLVSPQHRIVIRSRIAQRMFGQAEVLVPACFLLPLDGVEILPETEEVTYFHLLFSRHEIIFANGTLAESLYTGPEAMKALTIDAREEIRRIFPSQNGVDPAHPAARTFAAGRRGRRLIERHLKNDQFLLAPAGRCPQPA
ncbi:hypothetical protein ATO6_10600 [Oceanicola sp. 22II-s10i]|nr:hypothetical protein ATO6_10600 [Oceanicola sp. 22II-s10i]